MGQTTRDQIESHIRSRREDLRCNLEELEGRVKSAVDWREQFRRNPALGMVLAAGAGLLLATITTTSRRRANDGRLTPVSTQRRAHARHVWESVRSTLIEIAAARAMGLLTQLLAGRRGATEIQGEGDYHAARRHHHSDISRAARQAAPGNGL
jgi:hypothetical protein